MAKKRTRIGFIGLGTMGKAMAERLLDAGYLMTVWNRTAEKADSLVEAGARRGHVPMDVAKAAKFVIIMVTDDAALDNVLFGEHGLVRGIKRGTVVINSSTTSPAISYRAARTFSGRGFDYIEAPVTKNASAARQGALQILVGGKREAFTKAKPILETLGKSIHYIGDIGRAGVMKLACNLLAATMQQGFAEFFVFAKKAGIPFETVMEVLHAGPVDSPIYRSTEQAVVNPGGGVNFYLRHMLKDVNLALDLSRQMDLPLPLAAATRQMLVAARNLGRGDKDCSTIVELMAELAGVPVRG
ncbi:MAG: NAD(P)-dependent oxidoreductase [Phycisphaerae bacterium]|jgi:3-hydroxyisobutyrate dehydrogenase-like beta-hydroxyacid dehydrogenase|nr:NAD(P)-dependent oxidoreductase [Phycisphaerae bacterium]